MEYLSVSQFAAKHGMDVGNVRRYILQGRIPAIKIGNQWKHKNTGDGSMCCPLCFKNFKALYEFQYFRSML